MKDYWLIFRSLILIFIISVGIIPTFHFDDVSPISTVDEISHGSNTKENDLIKSSEKPVLLNSIVR